jgi:hypothetical protein
MSNFPCADEIWRPIPSLDGVYEASSLGRIRRAKPGVATRAGRVLRLGYQPWGHSCFEACGPWGRRMVRVNRAVCEAFYGPPPEEKMEAAHGDGNPANNHFQNLRWASRTENESDKLRHGTNPSGSRNGKAKLTEEQVVSIRLRLASGETQRKIASEYNMSTSAISFIAVGKNWPRVHPTQIDAPPSQYAKETA